jgi:hypothetical protein
MLEVALIEEHFALACYGAPSSEPPRCCIVSLEDEGRRVDPDVNTEDFLPAEAEAFAFTHTNEKGRVKFNKGGLPLLTPGFSRITRQRRIADTEVSTRCHSGHEAPSAPWHGAS